MPYGSIPTLGKPINRRKRGYANDGTQQLHEITLDGVVIRHSQGLFLLYISNVGAAIGRPFSFHSLIFRTSNARPYRIYRAILFVLSALRLCVIL